MKRIALIYGGVSREHEISLLSAVHVYHALCERSYPVTLLFQSKSGTLFLQDNPDNTTESLPQDCSEHRMLLCAAGKGLFDALGKSVEIDLAIPILHGKKGEDGVFQGFLEVCGIPYISTSLLGSSVGMYKNIAKALASSQGIPVLPAVLISRREILKGEIYAHTLSPFSASAEVGEGCSLSELYRLLVHHFSSHLIIKPDDEGSSIGVLEISGENEEFFLKALNEVMKITDRILIEPYLEDKIEVECAVIADEGFVVSDPVIIDKGGACLSYHTKYETEEALDDGSIRLDDMTVQLVQSHSLHLAHLFQVGGFARIDFFVSRSDESIYFNEINTIPGMTAKSVFPKMADQCGYPLPDLFSQLIEKEEAWNR